MEIDDAGFDFWAEMGSATALIWVLLEFALKGRGEHGLGFCG